MTNCPVEHDERMHDIDQSDFIECRWCGEDCKGNDNDQCKKCERFYAKSLFTHLGEALKPEVVE